MKAAVVNLIVTITLLDQLYEDTVKTGQRKHHRKAMSKGRSWRTGLEGTLA